MIKGRKPAFDASTLPGEIIESGYKHPLSVDDKQKVENCKVKGNRCGHDKFSPIRYLPKSEHKRRPRAITQLQDVIMKDYYHTESAQIIDLAYHLNKRNKPKGKQEIGCLRKVRSESRGCISHIVLNAILHYTNLTFMQIGYINPKTGKFHSFNTKFLINEIQRSLFENFKLTPTSKRIWSALRRLNQLGHIKIEEIKFSSASGKIYSDYAHIHVNPQLFTKAGVSIEELNKGQKAEITDFERYVRENKRDNFNASRRYLTKQQKLKARAEIDAVKSVIQKVNEGSKLSDSEKEIADRECPGHDRKREQAPLYRDYTGISQVSNKDDFIRDRERPAALGDILSKLGIRRPPS